jgi:hypothetical protein
MRFRAGGRTARRVPGEMNGTERSYFETILKPRQLAGEIVRIDFEKHTFKLADDTRYTPDFWCLMADGTVEIHEVKGFMEDDALVKIKVAASMFPEFRFLSMSKRPKKDGGGWTEREF